jgi:hypothetical protein
MNLNSPKGDRLVSKSKNLQKQAESTEQYRTAAQIIIETLKDIKLTYLITQKQGEEDSNTTQMRKRVDYAIDKIG